MLVSDQLNDVKFVNVIIIFWENISIIQFYMYW
jgi:hypothetical protein